MRSLASIHVDDLHASGLSDETITLLQVEAVRPHDIKLARVTSAYKIPYFDLAGQKNCFERWKLFPPITTPDGHTRKYHQEAGTAPHLYLPPVCNWQRVASDARVPLLLTEGEKKSAAGCQRGLFCLGIGGVWNWRVKLDSGERLVIPTIDLFQWTKRPVRLIPDSDVWWSDKFPALCGFFALGYELLQRGAVVHFLKLPDQGGAKVGLDDWLRLQPGEDWGKHLELIALDNTAHLGAVIAWHQRWRDKQLTQQHAAAAQADTGPILDAVYTFLGRFVAYPNEAAHVAHTLWIAHTHLMEAWESTPRIAFLSPEPTSGKTRALELTKSLTPRPIESVNATPAYLFRKVSDPAGLPTILYDEIDTIFGPRAKEHEDIRGLINAGHRRGAMAGRCVVKGHAVHTEELPAFCAVAMAGLGNLPDTILARSIIIPMRRRAPTEPIEPYRMRLHDPEGYVLRDRLAAWATQIRPLLTAYPAMPDGITDRNADVWEALLTVADAAGGTWPERARVSAVSLVSDARGGKRSLGVRLLGDLHVVFGDRESMWTEEILSDLLILEESPWGDLKGKPLDARLRTAYEMGADRRA